MPDTDLDRELARLGDEVRTSVPVPGLDKIVARHKQRVVRRRMQIGAVAAVLVVSMAMPLLREQMEPEPRNPAAPPEKTGDMPTKPFFTNIDFVDDDHGYAIRMACENGVRERCEEELLVTEDGTHWEHRRLPRPKSAPSWAGATLVPLGPDEIAVDWSASPATESPEVYRVHSTDSGRTWEHVAVPNTVTDTVAEIPDGGKLIQTCAEVVNAKPQCGERGVGVLLPGSGKSALLTNRPPLVAPTAGNDPTADGQWWMVGRDEKTNQWALAISDDDGRSWTTTSLNMTASVDPFGWSVVSSGGTLYATAIGPRSNTSTALMGVFLSNDGGQTWQRTWKPVGDEAPRRVFSNAVVGDDGTLAINATDGKAYVSRDGGRTFTEAEPRFGDYAYWNGTRYIAVDVDSGRDVDVSKDGVHWRTIEIG